MLRQLAQREVQAKYELDVVKFKKQQLREIRALLDRPLVGEGIGAERGLVVGDGGGEDDGGTTASPPGSAEVPVEVR